MRNIYAVSIGLTLAGAGCLLIDRADPPASGHHTFELTGIGYLLVSGGLILLITCLAASADEWVKARWGRASTRSPVEAGAVRRESSPPTESC
ncbi:hypothetical protein [Roseateles sp.]|uniref:hypothetical protein n=1 Tax=Roseateles sp. TaxID=1971397 RepID=UPI0031D2F5C7